MGRRGRIALVVVAVLAVVVVVGCEYVTRAVALPTFTNCTNRGTFVAISGFHEDDGDQVHGCHANTRFAPKVERRGNQLVVGVPRAVAEAFVDRATLELRVTRADHADQAWWIRLIDLLAPLSHMPAEVQSSASEPVPLEISLPEVIADADDPRLEFDASQLEDDVHLFVAVRSQQRA